MKRAYLTALLVGRFFVMPAFAGGVVDAKVQDAKVHCDAEYGSSSAIRAACEHGVDLAAGAPDRVEEALNGCTRDRQDGPSAAACREGVSLYARFSRPVRDDDKRSFSHTWKEGRGGIQLDVGEYELHLGDAEKSIEECKRDFEGSSTPPSCLSGITVQHKPPE